MADMAARDGFMAVPALCHNALLVMFGKMYPHPIMDHLIPMPIVPRSFYRPNFHAEITDGLSKKPIITGLIVRSNCPIRWLDNREGQGSNPQTKSKWKAPWLYQAMPQPAKGQAKPKASKGLLSLITTHPSHPHKWWPHNNSRLSNSSCSQNSNCNSHSNQ